MLIATETRKASVHGRFLNPSTKRSEVVNPTSNSPPTISHIQAMTLPRPFVTLACHGEPAHDRQYRWPVALSRLSRRVAGGGATRDGAAAQLGARNDGRLRCRRADLPAAERALVALARPQTRARACEAERRQPNAAADHYRHRFDRPARRDRRRDDGSPARAPDQAAGDRDFDSR